jgi:uncharacterized RDD family membrane protein YckC
VYFLSIDEQQAGPFTLEYLRTGWKDGTLKPDTLFWQEGMAEWQPLETIQPLLEKASSPLGSQVQEPAPAPMIIGGFWRRVAAFLIDVILLGLVGVGSGFFFFDFYMALGSSGLLIGLVVATAYFGLLNSRLGSGRTLGKRALGLRVVDAQGDFISPGKSILRYLILAIPFFLDKALTNGIVTNLSSGALLGIPVVAGFIALTYLLIFNRRTRQMVHDLAVKTYVVRATSPRPAVAPVMWRGHAIVVALLCILIVGFGGLSPLALRMPFLQQLFHVRQAVLATGKARTVTVTGGTTYVSMNGQTKKTRVYNISAFVKGHPQSSENMADQFAALALAADPSIAAAYDYLNVSISYGYDIGIASGTVTDLYSHAPSEWKNAAHP